MDATTSVEQAIVKLFETERFYAELLAEMNRSFRKDIPSVAGVSITDRINLVINPILFPQLSLNERVAVLKHECEHIMRDHISRAKALAPEVFGQDKEIAKAVLNNMKFKTMNIGMDMAINGLMPNLPKWGIFPNNFDLPDNESFEWYMNKLKDNEKANKFMDFDDHAIWGESDQIEEAIKAKIKAAMNNAAKRTRQAGQMTGELELLIKKLNEAQVSWRKQLRRFMARSGIVNVSISRTKRHRRYGITQPGQIRTPYLHLAVAMDTSGSVSDEALIQFVSELKNISKYCRITVVNADTEIKDVTDYNARQDYRVSGRGGTAYKPVFDFFNSYPDKIDGLIYFGDGDCLDTEILVKPKYPVIWALVGEQDAPAAWGNVIRIVADK